MISTQWQAKQARAVYREHYDALESKAWALARRIEQANPDLFAHVAPDDGESGA